VILNPSSNARTVLGLGLLGLGLATAPALAQKVSVEYDHDADFSRFHHYQWRTHPVFEKNPELLNVYSTGIQLVLDAGNTELMKKGFQPDEGSADVYVTFYLLAKGGADVKTIEQPAWGTYGWYGAPVWTSTEIERYIQGALIIDIIDARTSKVVWRAYCAEKVKDMTKRHKAIGASVRKAFDRFPPK
jgi:hypothetical protein